MTLPASKRAARAVYPINAKTAESANSQRPSNTCSDKRAQDYENLKLSYL